MKQASKNDTEILELINKIHAQLILLDKKVDALVPAPKPAVDTNRRMMYTAICADCQKECSIPFKPSPDRPVYCQDCFSRRKMISMSGMKVGEKPPAKAPEPPAKKKKKAAPKKK